MCWISWAWYSFLKKKSIWPALATWILLSSQQKATSRIKVLGLSSRMSQMSRTLHSATSTQEQPTSWARSINDCLGPYQNPPAGCPLSSHAPSLASLLNRLPLPSLPPFPPRSFSPSLLPFVLPSFPFSFTREQTFIAAFPVHPSYLPLHSYVSPDNVSQFLSHLGVFFS